MLSQLSYTPIYAAAGSFPSFHAVARFRSLRYVSSVPLPQQPGSRLPLSSFEIPVSRNFKIKQYLLLFPLTFQVVSNLLTGLSAFFKRILLRKEVIQPHLPIRLPCYDFTPIIDPTFGSGFFR